MRAYRIVNKNRTVTWQDAFTGLGSFYGGGRWGSIGTRLVYASNSLALAMLEVLVHANTQSFRDSRLVLAFTLDDTQIENLENADLPKDWNTIPAAASTQTLGDAWVRGQSSVGLIVPSAVLPNATTQPERNLLLNPQHPECFAAIQDVERIPLVFDDRLR